MISPLNLMEAPAVTYEYLFCLLSSDPLWPPTQRKAQQLLSGSSTSGSADRQLWATILDMIGSLQ
jgi:hypothetical protein